MSNDRLALAARVGALRQDLALAAAALASPAIRPELRDRVKVLFGGLIDRKDKDLKALADDLGSGAKPGRKGVRDGWTDFEQHSSDCNRLLKEYRAFVEGALYRSAGLDDGVCDLADGFLRQLSALSDVAWTRFTIFAEGEFFAPMTDIIRLRYPDFTIWNLPVLAHEFGHFVTPRLQDRLLGTDPLRNFRAEIKRTLQRSLSASVGSAPIDKAVRQLDEHIADAFAVYAAGPAFVAACLLLRFDPTHAWEDDEDHPSDGARAYLQLKMLGEIRPEYAKVRSLLTDIWQDNLAGAGVSGMPDADQWLDPLLTQLVKLFGTLAPNAGITAEDWRRAIELADRLTTLGPLPAGLTVRDVLNAAWVSRLNADANAAGAGTRALKIGRDLVKAEG